MILKPRSRFDLLDLSIGDSFPFQHSAYPHRDGLAGAESLAADKINALRLDSLSLDGDKMQLTVTGLERRLRDAGCFVRFDPPDAASLWNDGPTMMLPAGAFLSSRFEHVPAASTAVYLRNLRRSSDGVVARAYPGQWSLEPEGVYCGRGGRELVLNAFFASGNTSWTRSSGGGGNTPAVETTSGVFWADSELTTYDMKLEQDDPAVNVKSVSQAITIPLDWELRVVIRHRDDAGAVLKWKMQRASDSKWWNDATPDWEVGTAANVLPESGASTIARDKSETITSPGGADTYTLTIYQDTGGTGARVNRVYEVDLNFSFAPSTPIRTTTAQLYEAASAMVLSAGSADPIISQGQGTILMAFQPGDAFGQTGTSWGDLYGLFTVNLSGGDALGCYYDAAAEEWHLVDAATGDVTVAQSLASLQDSAFHWVALRYAGDSDVEDLEAGTFDIIADGIQGTPGDYAGFGAIEDQLALLGVYEIGDPWDAAAVWDVLHGHFRALQTFPKVLSPEECAAWARRNCL